MLFGVIVAWKLLFVVISNVHDDLSSVNVICLKKKSIDSEMEMVKKKKNGKKWFEDVRKLVGNASLNERDRGRVSKRKKEKEKIIFQPIKLYRINKRVF